MSYYYYNYDDIGQIDGSEADYETTFEDYFSIYVWKNTYETCILPSTSQIIWYMGVLLGWSLIGRIGLSIFSQFKTNNDWSLHTISILTGCGALIVTVGNKSFIIVCAAGISYAVFRFLYKFEACKKNIGVIMLLFALFTHFSYEFVLKRLMSWQVIQGPIMICNIKIISIAFELGESEKNQNDTNSLTLYSFFGYICMPTNLIIGPWVPYSSYLYSIRVDPLRRWRVDWIMWCLVNSIIALSFLNLSNCIVPLIFAQRSTIWVRIYRDAFSVRCSHYFVSFLSQALIAAGRVSLGKDAKPNTWLGHMVTHPLQIEFPRSLTTVVRSWNIPTHIFLKQYIFYGAYRRFGNHLFALFATYSVSALLHGEYIQIYLILLSLANFGFVEYKLREKVANAFNACVTANMCRKPCRFRYCPSHGWRSSGAFWVKLTNILFSTLTIFHLAYLGAMMNDTTVIEDESQTKGFLEIVSIWSSVGYVNHWIALFTFCLNLII